MNSTNIPTLLLDEQICRSNIAQMAQKARENGLRFRPHMKTHQSAEIGNWLRDEGTDAITVSSVRMARYFADNGWDDITIAFPCNLQELDTINALAAEVQLTLLVNSLATARKAGRALTSDVQAYIELDTGSNRTGLSPSNTGAIRRLINEMREDAGHLNFRGFYSHPGHSYAARSKKEILEVHQSVTGQIEELKNSLPQKEAPLEVCIGDTPCCSAATDFTGIDAISPGNFVFYDLMQLQIGSCEIKDIATAVQCPVVDRFPERKELAIYGGAIHFSKESITVGKETLFGYAAQKESTGWAIPDPHTFVRKLSQEHGMVSCSPESFKRYHIGDTLTVLPVHSCLTANLLQKFRLADGRIISQW